jgi:ectoine hydroxylase-related dioxygenase (phytanoyl-CoA dioxygenase family)
MRRAAQFAEIGVAVIEHALTDADLQHMELAFNGAPGRRQADLPAPLVGWLAAHSTLRTLATELAGTDVRLFRVLAFDKRPEANWFVPWHQDRADETGERAEADLRRIVTLRIHLDDCTEDDGPIEVLPGSHVHGRLDRTRIAEVAGSGDALLCLAARGDILAMRPLLVHRSQRARQPKQRRVLHLEFAPETALSS